jgi:hypothetical protein
MAPKRKKRKQQAGARLLEQYGNKENDEEFVYDEVTGSKGKKKVLSVLNKSKLSKYEMDEIFCGE